MNREPNQQDWTSPGLVLSSNATWYLENISDDIMKILVPVEFCSSARVGTHHHLLSNEKWFNIGVIEKVAIDGRSNVLWI
jgi:hypothetical protein